jgi:MFS family permease
MTESPDRARDTWINRARRDPVWWAICAVGTGQIISWGTTLYALGVLGRSVATDTGWSLGLVYGGLTLGLLVSSAISTSVGRLTDTRGGRVIMTTGAGLSAAGLALVALSHTPVTYLAAWMVVGLAMRLSLYDAAFTAIVQVAPSRGRRSISFLTLFGGFASTVFWPIGFWLDGRYGWRTTLLVFAAINLVIALPLYAIGLHHRPRAVFADRSEVAASDTALSPGIYLEGSARRFAMGLFAVIMAANAAVFGALASHLVPLIAATGVGAKEAITLAALKGVAQVAGRFADIVYGRNLHPVTLGRISVAILPLSLIILILGGMSFIAALTFTLVLGVSNGLITIVRGAVPLALFGPQGYGAVLGLLAMPYLLLNALAPMAFAVLAETYGYRTGAIVLLAISALALAAMEALAHWHRGLAVHHTNT